jgi:hypothetical protein
MERSFRLLAGGSSYADKACDNIAIYRTKRSVLPVRSTRGMATKEYSPICLFVRHFEPEEVFELFRAADLCIVSSLHDGVNLVAKEFVAARDDEQGLLILCDFAGAANGRVFAPQTAIRSRRRIPERLVPLLQEHVFRSALSARRHFRLETWATSWCPGSFDCLGACGRGVRREPSTAHGRRCGTGRRRRKRRPCPATALDGGSRPTARPRWRSGQDRGVTFRSVRPNACKCRSQSSECKKIRSL